MFGAASPRLYRDRGVAEQDEAVPKHLAGGPASEDSCCGNGCTVNSGLESRAGVGLQHSCGAIAEFEFVTISDGDVLMRDSREHPSYDNDLLDTTTKYHPPSQ